MRTLLDIYRENGHMSDCYIPDNVLEEIQYPESADVPISNGFVRTMLYKIFNGKCIYTGQSVNRNEMSIDHVIPKSVGGPNNLFNYALTSKRFNSQEKRDAFNPNEILPTIYVVRQKIVDVFGGIFLEIDCDLIEERRAEEVRRAKKRRKKKIIMEPNGF